MAACLLREQLRRAEHYSRTKKRSGVRFFGSIRGADESLCCRVRRECEKGEGEYADDFK